MTPTLQQRLDAALARAEAAEELLIDAEAMVPYATIRGLPACVVYAHGLTSFTGNYRAAQEQLLICELEGLDEHRLRKARDLARELWTYADLEILRRSADDEPEPTPLLTKEQ